MIMKYFSYFQKKRDKFLKGREFISIFIYFVLFVIIDYFNILNLYGQNIFRRIINMFRRLDPLNYDKKINPYCVKYEKMIDLNDIQQLQSIKIPTTKDFQIFSRTNTTTHQCCDNYSENEKDIIDNITEKLRKKYEEKLGEKLYIMKSNHATIYRYYGNKSQHAWHVDPQNIPEIYNIIVCIKKKGNISPLQCKNEDGEEHSIHFDEGDGALFRGGTTVHQVPRNDDPDSERTVLSIAFTTSEQIGKSVDNSKNLCTFIEGGNNYVHLFGIWALIFVLNLSLSSISGINNLSYTFLSLFLIIAFTVSRFVPYTQLNMGSGRAYSFYYNLLFFLYFIITTVSYKGAICFYSYFVLSDVFFPKKWVEYD